MQSLTQCAINMKTCPQCGLMAADNAQFCQNCGYQFASSQQTGPQGQYDRNNCFDSCGPEGKSRGVTALLALLFGSLGIHYFYLGKNTAGIISILLSLVSCGIWSIIVFIQAIYMFTLTNQQFREKYILNPSTFPLF